MLDRLQKAARVILKGETPKKSRNPIPPLSAEDLNDIKKFFPRDKFFIFGHARSGTTLLARLIRLHPDVHCNWQAHFFTRPPFLYSLVNNPEAEEWLSRKSNRWNHGRDLSPLVLRAAGDMILERDAELAGKRIVGDKSPSSLIHGQAVRDLNVIYPDATLIYIIRDGRDVLISERFRNFVEDSKFLNAEDRRIIEALKKDQSPFTNGSRSIFTADFIERSAKGWVENIAETISEGNRLFPGKFLTLRYEDLLAQPFTEMEKLWNGLGVPADPFLEKDVMAEISSNPDEKWQAEKNDSIASFLPKGKAGNWKNMFTQTDQNLFKKIAGQTLIDRGYEKDLEW